MKASTETLLRVEKIVHEALDAGRAEDSVWIEARCSADAVLTAEVAAMLDAIRSEERLSEECRQNSAMPASRSAKRERIGPYRIERLLGRGGMGAVYLAHRDDGQYEQKVAVKLLELPMSTEIFRARFRQERQILAVLQHPFIAQLLDGGVDSEGEPYLTMEFVDGLPIHRYCEDAKLGVRERIELFLRVTDAVEFAHHNLIVHRDLKPDNILVTSIGAPKLLDFGTAKLLSPELGETDSHLTRAGYLSFTPHYASPEQVLGQHISTASDTYSLGVLLFLLLTGQLPYELKDLSTAEMLTKICQEQPRRPSQIEGARKVDADLEAILLKAMRKEPERRYVTAAALASDLRAYLEGRPVSARNGTLRYQAGKFVRRNRILLSASLLLSISLAGGVIGILWQAHAAEHERQIAVEEKRKAEARSADLRQLSESLLVEMDDAIRQLPGSTHAQQLLVMRTVEHLDRMAKDAGDDRETQLDLMVAYVRLGGLQGDSNQQNIGDTKGALVSIGKAIKLGEALVRNNPQDVVGLRKLAMAQFARGVILYNSATTQEAVAATREAISTYELLNRLPAANVEDRSNAASSWSLLGDEEGTDSANSLFDLPAALQAYDKARDLTNQAMQMNANASVRSSLVANQVELADIENFTNPAQAIVDAREGLRQISGFSDEERISLDTVRLHEMLEIVQARALSQLDRFTEANTLAGSAVHVFSDLVEADSQDLRAKLDLTYALDHQASIYEEAANSDLGASVETRRRNLAAAEPLLARQLVIEESILKQNPNQEELKPDVAGLRVRIGSAQYVLRKDPSATMRVISGLSALKQICNGDHVSPEVLDMIAHDFLIVEPRNLRNPVLAVRYAERASEQSHRKIASILLTLAEAYHAVGRGNESRSTAREGLALLPKPSPETNSWHLRRLLEELAK